MEIISGNKQFSCILGLPKSGTTILSQFLNSPNNGFCISEPIRSINTNKNVAFGKVTEMSFGSSKDFLKKLKNSLSNSDFDFGGVKEAIWAGRNDMDEFIDSRIIDVFIFIFREPKANFASWKRFNTNADIDYFIASYTLLKNKLSSYNNSVSLRYENFCENPIEYINRKAGPHFKFSGELTINPTQFEIGDTKALKSFEILKANTEYDDVLSKYEINKIDDNLIEIYNLYQ